MGAVATALALILKGLTLETKAPDGNARVTNPRVHFTESNELVNNFVDQTRQASLQDSGFVNCEHRQLSALIDPLTTTAKVFCKSCFAEGNTRATIESAVFSFWGVQLEQHVRTDPRYGHAVELAAVLA